MDDGQGHQVRDCFHPRDLVNLLKRQMETSNDGRPPVVNLSGGKDAAMSLAQLSNWCNTRWGGRDVESDHEPRPFDLPWVVLDYSLAAVTWGWQPQSSLNEILTEIAEFAETEPDWIGQSS